MHTCTVSTAAVAILDSPSEKQKSFDYYAVKINLIFCLSHIKVIITDLLDVSNKCLDSKPLTLFGFITIVVGSGCFETRSLEEVGGYLVETFPFSWIH